MPTAVLDAYSKAYPSITNRIKASVLSATSPFAVVASIIDSTAGHPARVWHFPGLPRNNYGFSLDEINGGGAVVNNLALFSVVPGTIDGLLSRDDEQIQVGVTIGLVAGTTGFTFDGTGGKSDYIGWEIVPTEQAGGRGLMVRGVDYSWDKTTGIFALLLPGDVLNNGQYYNIHFDPIQNPVGNSYPTITDFVINLITANTVLDETYFGKKLIVEPAGVYCEVTLPDIDTVVDGRKMMVEVGGSGIKCVKFIPNGAQPIAFLRGILYAMNNESFGIYKFSRPGFDPEWRICEAEGNFKTIGQSVSDDNESSDVWNRHLFDGASLSKFQYARLYNEFVLQLPVAQVVNYDDHATGNNKYLWSLANSSDPGNVDKFLIPNRLGLFERNNQAGKPGDYVDDSIKSTGLSLTLPLVQHTASGAPRGVTDGPLGGGGTATVPITIGTGTETQPKNYLINKYFLV